MITCRGTMIFCVLVFVSQIYLNNAFVVVTGPSKQSIAPKTGVPSKVGHAQPESSFGVALWMAEEDDSDTEVEEDNETVDEEVEESEEEEEEEKEDPELVALKKEIAEAEKELKDKKRAVRSTEDRADDFTKAGYARKVAEMEQMKRTRKRMDTSGKDRATADVLQEFLPVLGKLDELKEKYGEDDFGKQYSGLSLKAAFNNLGVTDFTVSVGDTVDKGRMLVVDSEHSEDHPADTVLKPVSLGLELKGNIVKMAECVASLGPEVVADEEGGDTEEGGDEEAAQEDKGEE